MLVNNLNIYYIEHGLGWLDHQLKAESDCRRPSFSIALRKESQCKIKKKFGKILRAIKVFIKYRI